MSGRRYAVLACALLLWTRWGAASAQGASLAPPRSASEARIALGFNAAKRCGAVRLAGADDNDVAVIVFLVGVTGVPSRPAVVAPSSSQELDAAAMSCVLKLHFQPATRVGDGTLVESWQQTAWKRAGPSAHQSSAGAAALTGAVVTPPPLAGADAAQRRKGARAADNRAEVQVCVDAEGKLTQEPTLTHASGDAQFDEAAVSVARSGSGSYRSAIGAGRTAAGCVQVAITPSSP